MYLNAICWVIFQETCLAARPAMPFSILRGRLLERLNKMDIKILHVHEEVTTNLGLALSQLGLLSSWTFCGHDNTSFI